MQKIVVIGIGNPLRGDDSVGWAVVEALWADSLPGITAVTTHQLLPELIEQFYQASQVIFVDASVEGEPGDVCVTAVLPSTDGPAASHHVHPGVLMAFGEKLYGKMPPATLITITGQDFSYKEQLSSSVQEAIPQAIMQICELSKCKNAPKELE